MNFLFIKASSLGDIIHTFPAAAWIKKRYPSAKLDWIVEKNYAELLHAHPLVDRVIEVDTKKWRKAPFSNMSWQEVKSVRQSLRQKHYDAIFDMQGNIKSTFLMMMAKGKTKVGFGMQSVAEKWTCLFTDKKFTPPVNCNIREDNLWLVQSHFHCREPLVGESLTLQITSDQEQELTTLLQSPELQNKQRIMVCPGSMWKNKQLTTQSLKDFLNHIHQNNPCSFLFIYGNKEEEAIAQELKQQFPKDSVVISRLPIPVLQNLMARIDLVIAMDSLPLHLAGTTTTETFGIFGASSSEKYAPVGEDHRAFQGSCPYGKEFTKRCPILRTCETGACIREVTGKTVYESFINRNRLI